MRSRGFAMGFLVTLFSLVLVAFISLSACTEAQKASAENAINATTQPTQNLANGAAVAATTLPAPINSYAAIIAAAAGIALSVEKLLADYIIPALPTKSATASTANPAVTPTASTVPKPQVLPS